MEIINNPHREEIELIFKFLDGKATESEVARVIAWKSRTDDNQRYFDEIKNFYQLKSEDKTDSEFSIDKGWSRVQAQYYQQKYAIHIEKRRKLIRTLKFVIPAAAVLIIALLIGSVLKGYIGLVDNDKTAELFTEINVPMGAKAQITLSDGTKVWLNAGSNFRYPENLAKGDREVYLDGEAFFDVTKNKSIFIVHTSKLDVKVYGTQFNVKSYHDEDMIQTTLVRGSVAIQPHEGNQDNLVYLKPNQSATYYKSTSTISRKQTTTRQSVSKRGPVAVSEKNMIVNQQVNPVPITSWKDKRWVIVGEDLGDLAVKLERRYNVKISFENEGLKRYKFSGTLTDETFEQVLRIIQLSAPVKYELEMNHIVLSEDKMYKKKYDKQISQQN